MCRIIGDGEGVEDLISIQSRYIFFFFLIFFFKMGFVYGRVLVLLRAHMQVDLQNRALKTVGQPLFWALPLWNCGFGFLTWVLLLLSDSFLIFLILIIRWIYV